MIGLVILEGLSLADADFMAERKRTESDSSDSDGEDVRQFKVRAMQVALGEL